MADQHGKLSSGSMKMVWIQACLTPNENAGGFFLATSMQGAYSAGLGFVFLSHNVRIFGRIEYNGGRLLIRFTSCNPYDAGPGTFSLHLALRFLPALKTFRFRNFDRIMTQIFLTLYKMGDSSVQE